MDPIKARERVLVIPEERWRAAGAFTGFRPFDESTRRLLLDPVGYEFRPRGEVEDDPAFKQLIPYVVLRSGSRVFRYTRGQSGGEARLRALGSIGIGGHISDEDAATHADAYLVGMRRELREEVSVDSPCRELLLGFIYDPSTPVGTVHLGIVHLFDLDEPRASAREDALAEAAFVELTEVARDRARYETWSQLTLDAINTVDLVNEPRTK